ncbi:helicase-like transcription factor HLTF/DNA helicase RAD5, DEAD-box superfamily [Tricharina praecox]|uniref:helicase-like transcription factor HLTF/DNA helicase RAD5, DEAD-box superfamily n=1 Tax=Tricharina praecox TaxID=43433 RepID=UPI00221FFC77|nr:helicase-like transcription factor HLTF/DNA helicase RAD5, DEAD-box superfamily [Tricharina praecox]KAI5841318.1 helicase-like transcription factor HLTF/DNA helicase RAD5, DEAD-box superfamily [Tricharina praecox]
MSDRDGEDAAIPAAVPDAPPANAITASVPVVQLVNNAVDQGQQLDPNGSDQMTQKFGRTTQELIPMPYAAQPTRLATRLLPYQLQGLEWLLQQEDPDFPTVDKEVKLWKKMRPDYYLYIQTVTGWRSMSIPHLVSGGILADDMGLGKTLQTIALIVCGVDAYKYTARGTKEKVSNENPTLIVAPVSVMSNWTEQIAQHVSKENPLKVVVYHGPRRHSTIFADYDVVVTSYCTMAADFAAPGTRQTFEGSWRRLVLDEAHMIRSVESANYKAVDAVKAHSRWVLTGTSVGNGLMDLWLLICLLQTKDSLEHRDTFRSLCPTPHQLKKRPRLIQKSQEVMRAYGLRRTKSMDFIQLRTPAKTCIIKKVQFWPEERRKYSKLDMEANHVYRMVAYRVENGQRVGNDRMKLLKIVLRMRQLCDHGELCGQRLESLMKLSGVDRVELTPENVKALQDVLGMAIEAEEDCPICLERLNNPRITVCKHIFCLNCIATFMGLQGTFPMCRARLPNIVNNLVEPSVEDLDSTANLPEHSGSSSKISALLEILTATRTKDATIKTVVFSQWKNFLRILAPYLTNAGFDIAQIDGSMSLPKRDAAIKTFGEKPTCTILLTTLAASGVGLNLVMASQVVLIDSWWSPAVEDQAVDRIYRLGQTRDVTVWRLVMEDSVEERVLEVQNKKRVFVAAELGEGGMEKTLEDIKAVLAEDAAENLEADDDEPKDDEPKDDEPKEDEPKDDEPKDDEPKDDEPKDDEPKDDEPKDDEPEDHAKQDRGEPDA